LYTTTRGEPVQVSASAKITPRLALEPWNSLAPGSIDHNTTEYTVTTCPERVANMIDVLDELDAPKGGYLFTDTLIHYGRRIFALPWTNVLIGEATDATK
jgi:hypothetical protein